MTDIEDRIRQGLEYRADQVETPRTPINTIWSEARLVQRSRTRRNVGMVIGAVAAVSVVAIVVPRVGDDRDRELEPASRAPSESAPSSAQTEQALPVGAAPQVPFIVDNEYRTPDGSVLELGLPRQSAQFGVSEVTPFGGGALVADNFFFERTNGLFLLNGSQTATLEPCASGTGAASDDQQTIAWATFTCPETGQPAPLTVQFATADGLTKSFKVPTEPDLNTLATVVGIVGDSVVLNMDDSVVVADPDGTTRTIPEADAAVDVAANRAIVTGGPDGDRVVDVGTGRTVWGSDTTLLSFAPDGERVLGQEDRNSLIVLDANTGEVVQEVNLAATAGASVVVDSATGEVIQEFNLGTASGGSPVVWEDDSHLLYTVESSAFTSIVRISLGDDSEPEWAGEVFAADQTVVLPND